MASELPRDVLFNILSRFDVKQLGRFRCVSKSWKILISDPYFIEPHQQRSMKEVHFLYNCKDPELRSPYLIRSVAPFIDNIIRQHEDPFRCKDPRYHILPSYGGLIMFVVKCNFQFKLYLMNPVTLKMRELPVPSESCFCCLSFRYALGYLYSTGEFKVVRFLKTRSNKFSCQILVLNNGLIQSTSLNDNFPGWKTLDANFPHESCTIATLAGGNLFWDTTTTNIIVGFDLEINKVSFIAPPLGWPRSTHSDFLEIKGELGMSNRENTQKRNCMEIWTLKDKEKSVWVKDYNIELETFPSGRSRSVVPLHFLSEGMIYVLGSIFYMCDKNGENFKELPRGLDWYSFYWENLAIL